MRNILLASLVSAAGVVVSLTVFGADDNYSVSSGNQDSTVKASDTQKPEKKEEEKPQRTDTNYDVKKSHDEHIPATEKAAGEAAKGSK